MYNKKHTKKCGVCGKEKPLNKLIRNRTKASGRRNLCYDCGRIKPKYKDNKKYCEGCKKLQPLKSFTKRREGFYSSMCHNCKRDKKVNITKPERKKRTSYIVEKCKICELRLTESRVSFKGNRYSCALNKDPIGCKESKTIDSGLANIRENLEKL